MHNEHTTPSNTGLQNPREIIKHVFGNDCIDVEVCYVTRTYMTRHGAGPFPTECAKEKINAVMVDMTNVSNPHQGTLRYGFLNVRALRRRVKKDFGRNDHWTLSLAVTHINEYDPVMRFGKTFQKVYYSDGETRESVRCKALEIA